MLWYRERAFIRIVVFSLQDNVTKWTVLAGVKYLRSSPSSQNPTIARMTATLMDELLPYINMTDHLLVAYGRIGCAGC
jgi:hypothetical protein